MGNVVGIDLGTTYSCIAFLDGDQPKVIPNLEGLPTTPSVVSFTSSGERLIGNLASRQAITNPDNTVFAIKRLMGKKLKSKEVQEAQKNLPYHLAAAENGDVLVQIGENKISPQEISSMILAYLKDCAQNYFGSDVKEAVITVPAHFDDHQRQATKTAAKIAGINVLRVINEPTAACLAYGLNNKDVRSVAVYDMGGGTFDFTLMELSDGIFNVLATNGNSYLGGEDFDNRIVDWIIGDFKTNHGVDLAENNLALQRIKEAADRAKRELSFTAESEISLPFICTDNNESKHIKMNLNRVTLEKLTEDLVDQSFPHVEQAFKDSGMKPQDVDEVILVGGQTRMPLIKKKINAYFGKEPAKEVNPDEIVAMGASIQSAILKGDMSELVVLLDVTPLSLGIEIEDGGFTKIIERNTTIPTKKSMSFTTVENNQRRVRIHVLQGESPFVKDNISLAHFDLVGIGLAPAGVPQIDVSFEIDADGLVRVSAKDMSTGREQGIEVRPSSGLTKEEVNRIIKSTAKQEESEEAEDEQT